MFVFSLSSLFSPTCRELGYEDEGTCYGHVVGKGDHGIIRRKSVAIEERGERVCG